MNHFLRNTIAVVVGWLLGSICNMGLVQVGHVVFPIEGIDINDMQALGNLLPTLEYHYFLFPFLAHAIGTFVGALFAGLIAKSHKLLVCLIIGLLFFAGGIMVNTMISGPRWFTIIDLLLAYFPMAWMAYLLIRKK